MKQSIFGGWESDFKLMFKIAKLLLKSHESLELKPTRSCQYKFDVVILNAFHWRQSLTIYLEISNWNIFQNSKSVQPSYKVFKGWLLRGKKTFAWKFKTSRAYHQEKKTKCINRKSIRNGGISIMLIVSSFFITFITS